ncbi:MAG: amidohydrolase family protein [Rhodospirillaceae bacterium]|nr:amidohydrolase family protein [Rhodospirillaceae bacterium]
MMPDHSTCRFSVAMDRLTGAERSLGKTAGRSADPSLVKFAGRSLGWFVGLTSGRPVASANALLLILASAVTGVGTAQPASSGSDVWCAISGDLVLTNGRFLTVDTDDSIQSTVRIRGDRIVAVGDGVGSYDCDRHIDLGGRTAVPGLINNHLHFLRLGNRPGYDVRVVETSTSITELQAAIAARAAGLPRATDALDGTDFISIVDSWSPRQFAEQRRPTLAELDEAAPEHAVYMMGYPFGPGVTNSIGKRFFEAAGIAVSDEGAIAGQPGPELNEAQRAYEVLKQNQTPDDKLRSLRDLMRFSNTVGLSTVLEGGGGFPGPGVFDEYRDYDAAMALWREHESTVRLRLFFQSWARSTGGIEAIQQRVDNVFMGLGDDMLKVSGFGENIVVESTPIQPLELFVEAFTIAAEHGWLVHQHSVDVEELETHTTAMERVNATIPIANLHWNLSHVQEIDEGILERLKVIGAGVAVQNHYYHGAFALGSVGPPYRLILDSGVHMSAGSDGGPFSPWVSIYHMTTGMTSYGDPILADQAITRMEALRAWTLGSAWDAHSEDDLGSIEPGKLADIVVLSDDYLAVPDEALRGLKSVLTLIGGEIVYSDGSVVACGGDEGVWFRDGAEPACQLQ